MEFIDLHCSEDFMSKFLAGNILDFYKNHMLPSGRFLNLITRTQQVVGMFGTTYDCERLFSKMNYASVCCIIDTFVTLV